MLSRRSFIATGTAGIFSMAGAQGVSVWAARLTLRLPWMLRPSTVLAFCGRRPYLRESPVTLTSFHAARSAGGLHDYFSEGDYWWPDPANPDGPYIQHDGLTNPGNFTDHRHALIRLSVQMPALAAAWLITKDDRYARHAAEHLRAWFVRWRHADESESRICAGDSWTVHWPRNRNY